MLAHLMVRSHPSARRPWKPDTERRLGGRSRTDPLSSPIDSEVRAREAGELAVLFVEAVPNLSIGDPGTVASVTAQLQRELDRGGMLASVLDVHVDPDHQRSVWTIAGDTRDVVSALEILFSTTLPLIDMRFYNGVHPAMGAVDVVPLVPLETRKTPEGSTVAVPLPPPPDVFVASRLVAEHLWTRFRIPSYFYGIAAVSSRRVELPEVRRKFSELAAHIERGHLPDVGDPVAHPHWGATAVGIRRLLVAFNVVLESTDLVLGRAIAREIRRRRETGELGGVRALAFFLPSIRRVQISMNLTRPELQGVAVAFEAVRHEADRAGVDLYSAEVVGLAPRDALAGSSQRLIELCPSLKEACLEKRLLASGLLERLRSEGSSGGGRRHDQG